MVYYMYLADRAFHSTRSISTASPVGSRLVRFALSITGIGNSRNTVARAIILGIVVRASEFRCGHAALINKDVTGF